ncbi:MAG: VCBS repeat-containing protein [Ignavibacteriae bacterium]|nr:VCBS repeat-containing protein [Ignavibacteriota bacterium]
MIYQLRSHSCTIIFVFLIGFLFAEILLGQRSDSVWRKQSSPRSQEENAFPFVSYFEPRTALPGENILIVGKNFNSIPEKNRVDFGGVLGNVVSVSSGQETLVVRVPFGAMLAPVSVHSEKFSAVSPVPFLPRSTYSWINDSSVFGDIERVLLEKSPNGIASGDLDGDGNREVVLTYRGQLKFSIFKYRTGESGDKTSQIEELQDVTLPFRCVDVLLNDIDCDGRLDIVTIHHWYNPERTENNLSVFRNLGVGKQVDTIIFAAPVLVSVPPIVERAIVSDIDVDGKPDFVVLSKYEKTISFLRNISVNGSSEIQFDTAVRLPFVSQIPTFEVSDMDGDRKPELIAPVYNENRVEIWKNNSLPGKIDTNSFIKIRSLPVLSKPSAVTAADLNGDGIKELLVGSEETTSLIVFQSSVAERFQFREAGNVSLAGYPVPPLFVYDANSDGKPDIICLLFHLSENKQKRYYITLLQSVSVSERFAFRIVLETPERIGRSNIAIADIDNDSKIDFLRAERENRNLTIYRQLGPYKINWLLYGVVGIGVVLFVGGGTLVWKVTWYKRREQRQMEFSRRLIEQQEQERKRIAAEMHDSISQSILAIKNIAYLGKDGANDQEKSASLFRKISSLSVSTIEELRTIMQNLRPVYLDRLGLTESIRVVTSQLAEVAGITAEIQLENIDACIKPGLEINIFRIVQESLNNIIKHAEATRISIIGIKEKRNFFLMIEDNGKGFEQRETTKTGKRVSFGLSGIQERARILSGSVVVKSVPGKGTTITISIPLNEKAQA